MKLFNRVKDVVKVDFQNVIDKRKRKKNSPTAKLNQFMRNCETEIKGIEGLVNRQGELKAKLYQEKEQAEYMVKKRESQCEVATQAGEIELEKRAHEELAYYQDQAVKLEGLYEKAEKDEDDLQNQLQNMRHQLKEMHNRRLELLTREAAAHANKRLTSSLAVLSAGGAYLESFEKEIEQVEDGVQVEYERTPFDVKIESLERELNLKEKGDEEDITSE